MKPPILHRLLYWFFGALFYEDAPQWARTNQFPTRTTEQNAERIVHAREVGR